VPDNTQDTSAADAVLPYKVKSDQELMREGLTATRDERLADIKNLEKVIREREELGTIDTGMSDLLKQLKEGATIPGLDIDPSGDGSGSEKVKMTQAELGLRRQLRTAQASQNELLAAEVQLAIDSLAARAETEDLVRATNMEEQANATHAKAVNDIHMKRNELLQSANVEMQNARFAAEGLSKEERSRVDINRQLAKFAEDYADVMTSEELAEALRQMRGFLEEAASPLGKFKQGLKDVFESAMDVKTALAEAGVQAVSSFGDAIVDFAVTGKAAFADMTRSILQDLAKIFLKAALFKSISLIPGVGDFLGLKNGDVLGKNGIVPFASGGIVDRPTFFEYGKGGAGNFGVMGEAGPEAIMPLKRGPGGRLGVEVTNQGGAVEAMNRYSRKRSGSSSGGLEALESQMGEGSLATAPIDVRYNVERINSVDYVTADQFQSGLQSAAAQGAQRGEQNTLKRLQMSGSTRKRIGL